MALGVSEAGFSHLALVEWWAPAVKVLQANASDLTWDAADVLDEDVRRVLPQVGERGTPTLIAGGPPCQPFSLAGANAGHSDERNMFPAAIDIVRALRPRFVIFENVPGLLRPSFLPYLEYVQDQLRHPDIRPASPDETWSDHHRRILMSRSPAEYTVRRLLLDSADLGVAQNRKRVFIIAARADEAGDGIAPVKLTHSRDALLRDQWITGEYWLRHGLKQPRRIPEHLRGAVERIRHSEMTPLRPWRTVRDLLSTMPPPGIAKSPHGWANHIFVPGARAYPSHTGSALDLPSKTIKAGVHGVAGGEAMIRSLNGRLRYLTIREAAMVQGFPTGYLLPGSRSRVMGVIGNAVAVDVAAAIAATIADAVSRPQAGTASDPIASLPDRTLLG